tara:strand:+ start:42728 stop:43990 length:1263 start_codon:yes stop_codon:yes gene_type:complete
MIRTFQQTMRKQVLSVIFLLFLLLSVNPSFSQDKGCNCKSDLAFLHGKIKKTPSYKNNKLAYNDRYAQALVEAITVSSDYECFVLLNKLLLALNDNHAKIYGINKGATEEIRTDMLQFESFKNGPIFNGYPRAKIDLDSLNNELTKKQVSDVEGVYTKKNHMTIGVFKTGKAYQAVILGTQNPVWERGEIMYTLIPYGDNNLLSIGGDIASKRFIAYPERIENGFFLTMGFQKDATQPNYALANYPDSTYVRKEISSDITYLKIGSFNSWYPTLSDAEKFYKSLEGTLTKKNLIIDLRDNGGGGNRNSNILLKIVEQYMEQHRVWVIINQRTGSNAEQFTHKLSQFENCQTFGNRTNGTVAYELVDANYNLPCEKFIAVLTSKKHPEFLEIESIGITPQVTFNMDSDWLNQLVSYLDFLK